MKPQRIMIVAGARPNFIKIAPLIHAFRAHSDKSELILLHTGQHYDHDMSSSFFEQLDIPAPDINLGIGSGSHAEQVGNTMIGLEKAIHDTQPDLLIVVGDVNATCAAAITAAKERVPLAHIEAGLRSGDWNMPEEINRLVTDRLSSLHFTTDSIADQHLQDEGIPETHIYRVGNIMIDTLERLREQAQAISLKSILGTEPADYNVVTLHRPSNVDSEQTLKGLVDFICGPVADSAPVVWPIHPRTRTSLEHYDLLTVVTEHPSVIDVGPISYLEMLRLNMTASVMLTDSGGLQEESCILGTPCLTIRPNTERPLTLKEHGGSCVLVGNDPSVLLPAFISARSESRNPHRPPLWDGQSAGRIVEHVLAWLDTSR